MPLLLVDLDNTLSDRAASLHRWAGDYVEQRLGRRDDALAAEIERIDGDGLRPKPQVAEDLAVLLGLSDDEKAEIIKELRKGTLERLEPTPGMAEALDKARAQGWTPFVVSNGNAAQQDGKMKLIGLYPHVDGMIVSEAVGIEKPDARIFQLAAEQTGQSLEGAWMIGDSAKADIVGAHNAGIKSVWLARGRQYPAELPRPTAIADSFPAAVAVVLAG